jgi:hypothetical protein
MSTKINTLLLAFVIASFAGTMISIPLMIGSAKAQSEQGLEHACPPKGTETFSHGECTGHHGDQVRPGQFHGNQQ